MDLNATMIGQMLTFLVFVLFTMKYVWPPMIEALEQRRKTIAEGLSAAEEGRKSLLRAEDHVKAQLNQAKEQGREIVAQAERRAAQIVEQAIASAQQESRRMLDHAKAEVERHKQEAQESLKQQASEIALAAVEAVLRQHHDASSDRKLLERWISEVSAR